MADDDHIGLAAVQQSERHSGEGGMEERALPLDHVPVIGRGVRTQHLRGAGLEIRDDRVHRQPPAGDHDPGLAGSAYIHIDSTFGEGPRDRKGRIFLAERTVRPDRQQPLARPLPAGRRGYARRRRSHIDQPAAMAIGGFGQGGNVAQPNMHPADDVETGLQGLDERRQPAPRDHAPFIGDANHQRPRAARTGLRRRQPRQAGRDLASRAGKLAHAGIRRPVAKAEGRLGVARLLNVDEEQEVGLRKRQHGHGLGERNVQRAGPAEPRRRHRAPARSFGAGAGQR